jgi:hypothetical protein
VQNPGSGQIMAHKDLEPLPRPPVALTAPPQRESPVTRDLLPERFEPRQIPRNGVVIEVPTDDLLQPVPGFRNRLMRLRSSVPMLRSFAAIRLPTVLRCTVNLPLLWIVPQIWG